MVPFSLQHFEKLNDNTPGSGIITHKHIEVEQSTTFLSFLQNTADNLQKLLLSLAFVAGEAREYENVRHFRMVKSEVLCRTPFEKTLSW